MRPVDRGSPPTDENGVPLTFARYPDAKYYLVERLGPFCSYCERRLATDIAVEHLEAKSTGGAWVDWDNFLLACRNCNSDKGTKPSAGLFLPHTHNTSHAFRYAEGAVIDANPDLSGTDQDIARRSLALVGLNNLTPVGAARSGPTVR